MKVSALFFGCSRTFVYLCTEASRAVPERVTRQPSNGSHGGQYDAVVLTSKNSNYATAHLFQVGNTGWTGMRAYHDQALIDEFQRRGIDVSAVYDGKAITFAHPVRYDIADNRLATIG